MSAGKWKIYEIAKKYIADGTHDLDDTTTYKMALFLSTSNANTLSVGTNILGDLTNQHANANGYTTGGIVLSGISLVNSSGTITFSCTSPVWTASGGSIVCRFAVIYRLGTFNGLVNPLLCVCLLDTTPADITVTTGNTLTITIAGTGIFTLSGANVD